MAYDPPEVVMQKVQQVCGEKGDGQLTIRVTARRNPSALVNTSLAIFNDAHSQHLANIEGWLPKLVGGGEYTIVVNHMTNVGLRWPFTLILAGNPFPQINVPAISGSDWSGPTNLLNPPSIAQTQQDQGQVQQQVFQQPFQQPLMAVPQRPHIPPTPALAQAFQQMSASSAEQLLTVQREEARANEQLNRRVEDLNRREIEDRMRREAQDREAKLKAEFAAQLASIQATIANKPAEKPADPMDGFAKLAAAFAPLAQSLIQSNTEMKRLQIEQAQRHAEMQATTARELAAIQAKTQDAHNTLMMQLLNKPSGPSAELQSALDMARFNAESQSAMMTQVINATGMVSKMSIGMIETIADMTAPPEGSPVMDAIKEGTKALLSLAKGADSGARGAVAATQKASIPAKTQTQPTPAQIEAAKQRAAQINAQAAQQQAAAVAAKPPVASPSPPTGATAPANVVQFPAPPPPPPPPPAPEAEVEMPDGFAGIQEKTVIDELRNLILAHHEPVESVAKFFLDNLKDPVMDAALRAPGIEGDPSALLASQLGLEWALDGDNQSYIERLGESLEEQAEALGLLTPEDDSPSDDPDSPEPPSAAVVDASPVKEGTS